MAVICVARELAALGDETVKELARITGYRPVDKAYIENRMSELGMSPETRSKYDEKKPGFWASLSQDRDDYLHYLKTVLYEEASRGDCIVAGRGGFAIFAGVPGVISIKLVSPLDARVQRVRAFYQCDEKRALHLIKQSDHDRKGFHDYFFNLDWNSALNFDIVINTGREHPTTIARMIDRLRELTVTAEREKASLTRLAELRLGQAVIGEIIYRKGLPIHFMEADVRGGTVTLHGVANTQGAVDSAAAIAAAVPGVESVENAIQIVQDYAIMP